MPFELTALIDGKAVTPDDALKMVIDSDMGQPDMAALTFNYSPSFARNKMGQRVEVTVPSKQSIFRGNISGIEPTYKAGRPDSIMVRAMSPTKQDRHAPFYQRDVPNITASARKISAYHNRQVWTDFALDKQLRLITEKETYWTAMAELPLTSQNNSIIYPLGSVVDLQIEKDKRETLRLQITGITQVFDKNNASKNRAIFKLSAIETIEIDRR